MFGAWQAGAWRSLAARFKPDLVVGASVGSLNGYAIAAGWSATDLCHWWLRPGVASFQNLPKIVHGLIDAQPLEIEYAVVLVDLFRMKPRTVCGPRIRPEHLLASCAVPLAFLPRRIDGIMIALVVMHGCIDASQTPCAARLRSSSPVISCTSRRTCFR